MHAGVASRLQGLDLDRATLLRWGIILNLEAIAVLGYLLVADVTVTEPRFLLYPFIWINVGLWAVLRVTPASASRRTRLLAGLAAVGYFAVLAYAGGLISPGHFFHGHSHGTSLRVAVAGLPPGWGPGVFYTSGLVSVTVVPFKLAGYLALAYLIYATVIEAAGAAMGGVIGLFSCVSCTWPVLGTALAGLFGSASVVASAAQSAPYGLSTLVFLSAVGLLVWRPGLDRFG